MIRNHKLAAVAAVALAIGVVMFSMWTAKSHVPGKAHIRAAALEPIDDGAIEKALRGNNLAVSDLSVHSVGGIVILRGSGDAATAEQAVSIVKSLGPQRVANLITPVATIDDEAIRRAAERQLATANSLAGCTLRVRCEKGVLSVTGTVQHELQKDAARSVLKAVRGAKEVRVDLSL